MPEYQLGLDCKTYASDSLVTSDSHAALGTAALAATLLSKIKDAKASCENKTADASTRESKIERNAPTMQAWNGTFNYQTKVGDTGFEMLRDAYTEQTEIFVALLDQAASVSGAQGPAGNWIVTKFEVDQGLNNTLIADVEIKPSSFNRWLIVGGTGG